MGPLPKPHGALGPRGEPHPRTQIARSEPRVRTHLRTGQILDLRRNVLAECLILDMSPHGARLKLRTQFAMPPKLLLVYDERSQGLSDAEVRWYRKNVMGLYFKHGTLKLVKT